jgi:HEAT repeat protein
VDAAERRDRSAIPRLIECLSSDDPAVRMAAIRALERITGQTLGYEHSAPEWRRREMVDVWLAWLSQESPALIDPADRAER